MLFRASDKAHVYTYICLLKANCFRSHFFSTLNYAHTLIQYFSHSFTQNCSSDGKCFFTCLNPTFRIFYVHVSRPPSIKKSFRWSILCYWTSWLQNPYYVHIPDEKSPFVYVRIVAVGKSYNIPHCFKNKLLQLFV